MIYHLIQTKYISDNVRHTIQQRNFPGFLFAFFKKNNLLKQFNFH